MSGLFVAALRTVLEDRERKWFYEQKYGGAPLTPGGLTWQIDRLWRVLESDEPLATWFLRIKLHSMCPGQWKGAMIPMHRHAPGAVVIGFGSTEPGVDPLYRNVSAPARPNPESPFEPESIAEHLMCFPFVYRIRPGSEHSVGFGGYLPIQRAVYTVTLIPRFDLPLESWPPAVDEFHRIAGLSFDYAAAIEARFQMTHEGRRMSE